MKKLRCYPSQGVSFKTLSILFLLCCINSPSYSQKPLVLGIHPYRSIRILEKKFTPLTAYLSKELGQKVVLRVGTSYQEHIDAIGQDQIDIAYMGPVPYIDLVNQYGVKPLLACQVTNGSPTFEGIIVTRKDNSATSLAEIKGDFSFVDPQSTMGYILPAYMLLHDNPEILKKKHYQFLKSHENVALGVLAGDFEAGAVKESVYHTYEKRGLKQLVATPAVAEHLFVASSKIEERLIPILRQAFFKLKESPEGQGIMQAIKPTITDFIPISDSDYDSLRHIVDELAIAGIPE